MYEYAEDNGYLNSEEILLRVTQEEIFTKILGEEPDIRKSYLSFVRNDNVGGCSFSYYNGKLYFVDFGHTKTHLDCFGIVQELYKCSYTDALSIVDNVFDLGLSSGIPAKVKYKPVTQSIRTRKHTDIIYKVRPFSKDDKNFWTPYGISRENLLEDSVVPILWYKFFSTRMGKDVVVRPYKPTFGFTEFSPKIKIYSPYMPKNRGKWISNVTKNDIGGLHVLPGYGNKLIITKGYKDWRVLRNFGIDSVWFQNEGVIPDDEHIISLCKRFNKIIVLFDNDETGIKKSQIVKQSINSHYPTKANVVIIPQVHELVKDTSDFYKIIGKYKLLNFLAQTDLI